MGDPFVTSWKLNLKVTAKYFAIACHVLKILANLKLCFSTFALMFEFLSVEWTHSGIFVSLVIWLMFGQIEKGGPNGPSPG